MLARTIVFGVLLLAGAALAADHFAIVAAGGNTLPIRTGEGGAINALLQEPEEAPPVVEVRDPAAASGPAATPIPSAEAPVSAKPARPRFCGFAPCGMPLPCDEPGS